MAKKTFDVVLLDLIMPGPSGFELLAVVKEKYPRTVYVIITGMDDSRVKAGVEKHGADAFLGKPFNPAEAVTTVKQALERKLRAFNRNS